MLIEIRASGLHPEDVDYMQVDFKFAFVQHKREFLKIMRGLEDTDRKRFYSKRLLKFLEKSSTALGQHVANLQMAASRIYNEKLFDFRVEDEGGGDVVVKIWISDDYLDTIDWGRNNLPLGIKHYFRGLGRSRSEWMKAFDKGMNKDYKTDSYDVQDVTDKYKDKEAFFGS